MIRNDLSNERIRCYQLHLGGDRNFCYLLGDPTTNRAAAVDPGFEPEAFHATACELGLDIHVILVTHGHPDHTGGCRRLAELAGARVRAGAADAVPGAFPVADGQVLEVGELAIECLETPGHSPGHFCYLCEDRLVTGDLLFCGKVGGTGDYFPGSSAEQEWDSLQRLMQLPPDTLVLPGHDYYGGEGEMPHSTIGFESVNNPFLTAGDFAAFQHLKDNWAAYKKEHGIR
jgi:glyoxylase-like metal-dependent hydrolase (beta-lactamase superfamily II)